MARMARMARTRRKKPGAAQGPSLRPPTRKFQPLPPRPPHQGLGRTLPKKSALAPLRASERRGRRRPRLRGDVGRERRVREAEDEERGAATQEERGRGLRNPPGTRTESRSEVRASSSCWTKTRTRTTPLRGARKIPIQRTAAVRGGAKEAPRPVEVIDVDASMPNDPRARTRASAAGGAAGTAGAKTKAAEREEAVRGGDESPPRASRPQAAGRSCWTWTTRS